MLLEDLLEQEKREQELQQHAQSNLQDPKVSAAVNTPVPSESGNLLSDTDFEHLKADVLGSPSTGPAGLMPHAKPGIIDD